MTLDAGRARVTDHGDHLRSQLHALTAELHTVSGHLQAALDALHDENHVRWLRVRRECGIDALIPAPRARVPFCLGCGYVKCDCAAVSGG